MHSFYVIHDFMVPGDFSDVTLASNWLFKLFGLTQSSLGTLLMKLLQPSGIPSLPYEDRSLKIMISLVDFRTVYDYLAV